MPTAKMIRKQSAVAAKYGLRRSLWCGLGYADLTRLDRPTASEQRTQLTPLGNQLTSPAWSIAR